MKEEIIEKLIKSPNKDDLLLGLEYAWTKFKPNRNGFRHYLIGLRPPNGLNLDIYIGKEVNIRIYPGKHLDVYSGLASEMIDVETIHI